MKKACILLIFCIPIISFAQQSVTSAGANNIIGNTSLSWVIGETIVGSYQGSDTIINFGVQSTSFYIEKNTSIEFDSTINVTVYPNPTQSTLLIKVSNPNKQYFIYDLQGKIIFSGTLKTESVIDFTDKPNGTYFLHIDNSKIYTIIKK